MTALFHHYDTTSRSAGEDKGEGAKIPHFFYFTPKFAGRVKFFIRKFS
jgi:hypothetical protein